MRVLFTLTLLVASCATTANRPGPVGYIDCADPAEEGRCAKWKDHASPFSGSQEREMYQRLVRTLLADPSPDSFYRSELAVASRTVLVWEGGGVANYSAVPTLEEARLKLLKCEDLRYALVLEPREAYRDDQGKLNGVSILLIMMEAVCQAAGPKVIPAHRDLLLGYPRSEGVELYRLWRLKY
jgi:hypothetical protein